LNTALPLDHVFARCGVQFRTASYEEIPQTKKLDKQMFSVAEQCGIDMPRVCRPGDRSVATKTIQPLLPMNGIPIFLGGNFEDGCNGTGLGITCTAACGIGDDFKRGDQTDSWLRRDGYVALGPRDFSYTLAHEVGHYLGLTHTNDSTTCGPTGPSPNLMRSAPNDATLEQAALSDSQCNRVRCVAERWLVEWGKRPRGTEYDCE
jgi:hypothetical protein